ncbi:MAG: macro domain-containing protein [Blastocatellia bacterium]|nr:macro domain-containing protein [Blastocatellia bacterium]
MKDFHLILVDPNPAVCTAWKKHFKRMPRVKIVNSGFEDLPEFDCMVSAANSFGLMDGGVDLAIIGFFGVALLDRVQQHILTEFRGEQPVGTSVIIETGHPRHPFLAHTPTMRLPMPIALTDHVYTAMWAMLLAIDKHNRTSQQKIGSVACPGLGTATGCVPPAEAARQMALAYYNFLHPPTLLSWPFAQDRQNLIGVGGDLGLKAKSRTED